MKCVILAGLAMTLALAPAVANAAHVKKHRRAHHSVQPAAVAVPYDIERGNAALGGNNANSAFGSNSANENANGRSGGYGGN